MKVLFIATYGDFLSTFELSNICLWQSLGCEVHCAANFSSKEYNRKISNLKDIGVMLHEVDFLRKPIKRQNLVAYKTLVGIIKKEKIDVVDCHNAIIGVFARLAAEHCNVKYVIYTAHGFAFYSGCKSKSAKIFSIVENVMAKKTDLLITINNEDYHMASLKMKVRDKAIYVPGVGLDTHGIQSLPSKRKIYCDELTIPSKSQIFLMVGELIQRKNHETALRAFAKLENKDCYLVVCGIGELEHYLEELCAQLQISERVRFVGYRLDVKSMMRSFDCFLFPSLQEGLPVALMEAMAAGMSCIVSDIRGNNDLIKSGSGGYLFKPNDVQQLTAYMDKVLLDSHLKSSMGCFNQEKIKAFDKENVQSRMLQEYSRIVNKLSM